MQKYIVIDTWNGGGYSSENGTDTKQFDCKDEAFKWAYERALSNADDVADDVGQYSDEEWFEGKPQSNGDGYWFEGYDGEGSYQVWETDNAYAIMIQCNVNEVTVLTEAEYKVEIHVNVVFPEWLFILWNHINCTVHNQCPAFKGGNLEEC